MRYLCINLTKFVQDLYEENYKTLMKDIKELSKWEEVPCSWMERPNIVTMSVLPNLICKFNRIPIKVPASYFVYIDKVILKFIWSSKRLRRATLIIKGEKSEDRHYPTSRLNIKLQ